MGSDGVRLHLEGVVQACSFFDAAADHHEGVSTSGLDNGIAAALPGGASGAACSETADAARTALAALTRRSRTLADSARAATESLVATDQAVAEALDRAATWGGPHR